MTHPEPTEEAILQALKDLQEVPPRRPEAVHRGREQYMLAVEHFLSEPRPVRQTSRAARFPGWSRFPLSTSRLGVLLASLVLAALLFLGSGGILVASAQGSLPGENLYAVKRWSERVRYTLALNPEARFSVQLDLAERRLTEMNTLAAENAPVPASLVADTQAALDNLLFVVDALPGTEKTTAYDRVLAVLEKQAAHLPQGVPAQPVIAQVRAMVADHLELVLLGKTDPEAFHQAIQEKQTGPRATPPGQLALPPGKSTAAADPDPSPVSETPGALPGEDTSTSPQVSPTLENAASPVLKTPREEKTPKATATPKESPTPKELPTQAKPKGDSPEPPAKRPPEKPTATPKPTSTEKPAPTQKNLGGQGGGPKP